MKPGTTHLPATSMTWAPAGTWTEARRPMAWMREPAMTMTESGLGGPPFPSMTVAPVMAMVWAAADRQHVRYAATFHIRTLQFVSGERAGVAASSQWCGHGTRAQARWNQPPPFQTDRQ